MLPLFLEQQVVWLSLEELSQEPNLNGLLADHSRQRASLDELNGAAAAGWAGLPGAEPGAEPEAMKITADTNGLVRALGQDDPEQALAHQGLGPSQEGHALLG